MHPHPCPPGTPRCRLRLGVGEIGERLTGQNDDRTNCTIRSTLGLSVGVRTRAGSITNPRDWAYSTNASFNLGSSGSAVVTTGLRLSGINTLNTPSKNCHAASHPAITAPVVCVNDNHTNMCRENTAVKINA